LPKEKTGILVDEQFGAAILSNAASKNVVTACPTEKSGQDEFAKRYREFVDLFERANTRLPSELSDRTRSRHRSSKEA
jgi:5-dehydro-2-deoxygluconokinase